MNFGQYQALEERLWQTALTAGAACPDDEIAPLALAYIGDAVFNLYVRARLLAAGKNKVRVLHGVAAALVSAAEQADALAEIMPLLTAAEADVVRRGRNSKATVPKSASMGEYRQSTGFECLLGWLYWRKDSDRLDALLTTAFDFLVRKKLRKREFY
jgi:ribonuclease-3 family protein